MTDLNKEREAFEELPEFKYQLEVCEWDEKEHIYINTCGNPDFEYYADACNGGFVAFLSQRKIIAELKSELEKAKAQAVPEGYVVVEKKDIENWYLDESEYMWFEADGMDGYLEDIDIGQVIEVQRKEYVVTNSNPVFAAKAWDDDNNCVDQWDFFESKDEAEKAAKHCREMFETSESGAGG